jgi:hypothetical protein
MVLVSPQTKAADLTVAGLLACMHQALLFADASGMCGVKLKAKLHSVQAGQATVCRLARQALQLDSCAMLSKSWR